MERDEVRGGEVVDGAPGVSLGFFEPPGAEVPSCHRCLQQGARRSALGGRRPGQPLHVEFASAGDQRQSVKRLEHSVRRTVRDEPVASLSEHPLRSLMLTGECLDVGRDLVERGGVATLSALGGDLDASSRECSCGREVAETRVQMSERVGDPHFDRPIVGGAGQDVVAPGDRV